MIVSDDFTWSDVVEIVKRLLIINTVDTYIDDVIIGKEKRTIEDIVNNELEVFKDNIDNEIFKNHFDDIVKKAESLIRQEMK